MGSAEETTPPPKSTPTSTAPSGVPQDSTAVSLPPNWTAAVQAYYAGATPPPFFSPPVWGSQHLMPPYGTPIPYSPMYPHPVYAHPPVAAVAMPAVESGSNNKSKGKSGDGGKVTSGSADEHGSQSSGGESGSEGSSDTRENNGGTQDAIRKRPYNDAFNDGENSQPRTAAQNNGSTAESSYSGRQRTVSKLPVSAPGRTTLPGSATNLNIGMDVWGASHVGTVPVNAIPTSTNVASLAVGGNGAMPDRQWVQDERELKRERRKQSNRESARRSRLRKQQECEDLGRKVNELSNENNALKAELEQLYKVCKELEAENASITEELTRTA